VSARPELQRRLRAHGAVLELRTRAPTPRGDHLDELAAVAASWRRYREAVDVAVGSLPLGQQAEALVDIADMGAGSLSPLPGKGAA
jgi:hypothetical protein